MNSDVPSSEHELSQDGSLENNTNEIPVNTHTSEEESNSVGLSDDSQLEVQLENKLTDEGNDKSATTSGLVFINI